MTDDQEQDEGFSEDEWLNIADVPTEFVARVDAALLAHTKKRFQKVAMVVILASRSIPDAPESVTDIFYVQRIAHLVRTSQMESQGDLRRMRFSEIRLPSPPLTKIELEELDAQGDYWTLGCIYADGQGAPRDYVIALRWHRIAAERGEVWSQFNVGRFYMNGLRVEEDYKEAYFWFSLALNNSSDKRIRGPAFGYWLDQVAPKLSAEERAEVDKRVAAWRPTTGFTG